MYNVLIAEDSKPILRNIKGLLEASGLPVRIAATAANGEEALAAFRSHSIDIMLTDIRMPKMDGLTLIEQAKMIHPKLKAVLISGFNDFEYTRKALNLQVNDYLLKPVTRAQLIEVMESVIAQLQEAQGNAASLYRGIVEMSHWTELDSKFYENPKVWVDIRKQPFAGSGGKLTPAFVVDCLGNPPVVWAMPSVSADRLLLLADDTWVKAFESPAALLEDVRLRLLEAGLLVSLGGSFEPLPWNLVPEKIRTVSQLLDDQIPVFKPIAMDFDQPWLYPQSSLEETDKLGGVYAALAEQHNKERFALMLSEQLVKWNRSGLRLAELKRFVRLLASAFASQIDGEGESESAKLFGQVDRLFELPDYETFCAELLELTEQIFQSVLSQNKKSGFELFEQIERFLSMNLYANIGIQDLVGKFHVSPSYISRIMKRHSGQTFVHYYTDLKISEARRLMEAKPEMLIKEISDALCFGDQHYFSKVFKEHVGCSPLDYKNKIQG